MESGQTIAGKYRLNRQIGSGGMATVWSATNIFTEREFAIKFMLPQVARTPEAARRFLLEAKISARINHPNIIEVIDVGQAEDGSLFLVMELLTGQALETAMRRQVPAMPVKDFTKFMVDVARALAAAHRSGVIHRDLKPTNIFLHRDRDGVVVPKILDFGVSKILEDEVNNALTVAGTVLGSPLYMSPEQASGSSNIDGRTDIFAFGSILFEALCGKRAFDAHNFNALIVTIATQQPLKIDDVAPHIPEPLKAIVRECMVTDRTKRVATFDKVAEKLQQALPQLESCTLRLPSPYGAGPASDPDATNALPVIPSDRQPGGMAPQSLVNTVPPRSNSPPGAFASPWGAPPLLAKLPGPPWALAVGAGGALLALLIVVVLVVSVSRGGAASRTAAAQTATTAAPRAATSANAGTATDPPEVNVDSLPVAPKGTPRTPSGKLAVSSGPSPCTVSIDGVAQGQTPTTPLALPPGVHNVECRPASGKVRTASVTVQDGVTERYKFVLDEN